MNPRFLPLCSAICVAFSTSAWAGFAIVNPPQAPANQTALPPAVTAPAMGNSSVMLPSNMPAVLPPAVSSPIPQFTPTVLNGFGRDIPLSIAVKQIVPAGVRVNFDNSVDATIPVSWHGGKPWQDVLADALRPNSLFVSENSNGVTISSTRPMPSMMAMAPMPIQVAAAGPQITSLKPVALAPIEIPTWSAKSSDTLHQTLEAWCKKAGVKLQWDSEYDYPIETDVSLQGDFETSVRTLLRGLKNAAPSPVARYYRGNQGMPGVLLVPSPSGDRPTHVDVAMPTSDLPPAVMPAISNMPQN